MNAISASCACDISAIVNEKTSLATASKLRSLRRKFKQNSRGQLFFAKLNEGNFSGDGSGHKFKDGSKLSARRSCLGGRGTARDQVGEWRLHWERHCVYGVPLSCFPAKRGAYS